MSDVDTQIGRASQGDREALQNLVVAHLDDLERFIRCRTGDHLLGKDSLADLVQSSAREALDHLSGHDYQGAAAFKGWLYKIALTKIVARYRYHHAARRDVRREQGDEAGAPLSEVCATFASPSRVAIGNELRERFTAAFAKLSEKHQRIFFLARVVELPHVEIARQLGCTEQASRKLLVQAVARLGGLMSDDAFPGAPEKDRVRGTGRSP